MQRSTAIRLGAVGTVCALAGGAAGIAVSSASSPKAPRPIREKIAAAAILPGPLLGLGPLAEAAGPPVHSDSVVPNEKGGFDTVTMDRGSVVSLSGEKLTMTEGTKTATYKTLTLTIPASATVRRNGDAAHVSELKAGDTVLVLQGPKGTVLAAHDAQHADRLQFKLKLPDGARPPQRPPKLPPGPDESASSRPGEGPLGPETGPSS